MKKLVDILGKEEFEKLSEETQNKLKETEFIENDGSYIPKTKFDNLNETKKDLENQLKETNEKVQELSKVNNEDLQTKLDELQSKYDEDLKKANDKYEAREYEYKLKDYIKDEKFSSKASQKSFYNDLLSKQYEFDDEGNLKGYDDFKKSYQEEDPKAFVIETEQDDVYVTTGENHDNASNNEDEFINRIMGIK